MNSYTKLKDGSWGVRATQSNLIAGDNLIVTKKDGTTKTETVKTVLWTGADNKTGQTISLCAIAQSSNDGHADHARSDRRSQLCDECGRPGATIPCRDSSGIGGVCCSRCASMSQYERSFC